MMEKNNIPVFSPKLARKLLLGGYKMVDMLPNYTYPGTFVYYFEMSDGLAEYIAAWKKMKELDKENKENEETKFF